MPRGRLIIPPRNRTEVTNRLVRISRQQKQGWRIHFKTLGSYSCAVQLLAAQTMVGLFNSSGSPTEFLPVVVDSFPDALPILYYRRNPGVDVPSASANSSVPAAYYTRMENIEFAGSQTLQAGRWVRTGKNSD